MKKSDLEKELINQVRSLVACFFIDHQVETIEGMKLIRKVSDEMLELLDDLKKGGVK